MEEAKTTARVDRKGLQTTSLTISKRILKSKKGTKKKRGTKKRTDILKCKQIITKARLKTSR